MKYIEFIKKYYKESSKFLLISIAFFILSLFVFFAITDEIVLEKETQFDETIFLIFKDFIVHQKLNSFVQTITDLSSPSLIKYLFPIIAVALFLFKLKRQAVFFFISGSGGLLLLLVFKRLFERARPPYPLLGPEVGFSFPSGHATFSFIFYGAIAYLFWISKLPKYLRFMMIILLLLLSFSIGISRIYLRVHFPSDVVAGFALGYSWLFLILFIFRKWFPLK